jgi:hypothetical protein
MKKVNFSNKSDIRFGFEIECVIKDTAVLRNLQDNPSWSFLILKKTSKLTQFKNELKKLSHPVIYGYDGSIECNDNDTTAELKTPPLPPKDAMILLKQVFDIVNKYGYTNSSCGFHVNISSSHKTKMKNFNPIPFLSSKLWNEILRKFNRGNNEFCRPIIRSNKISKMTMARRLIENADEKYRCVNLKNFGNGMTSRSRVEIRGFGNVNYSKKYDTISEFVKRIERLFRLSCGAFSEMKTPRI